MPDIEIGRDYLLIDGQPRFIYGGDLNYLKMPRHCWRDRMRKLVAAGMNTITFYCTWAFHEPERGDWHFEDNLDVGAYLDLAQEEGLFCIVRIGPFVHGEMRNGGLPQWLFDELGNKVRTNAPEYLQQTEAWYEHILEIIAPRLITRGGPIIMLQMENELGSAGSKGDDVHRGSEEPEERGKHIRFYNAFLQRYGIDIPIIDINKPYPGKEDLPLVDTGGGYPVNCFGCDGDLGPINLEWWHNHVRPRVTIESGSGMFARFYDWPPYRHANTFQGPVYPAALIEAQGLKHLAEGCKGINWFVLNDAEYPAAGAERMLPQRIYSFQAPLTVAGNLRESYRRLKRLGWFLRAFEAEVVTAKPNETWASAVSYGIPHPGAETAGDDLFEGYHKDADADDSPLRHVRRVKAGGIVNKGLNLSESNFLLMSNFRATGAAWQRDIRVTVCSRGIPCEVQQEYPKRSQMDLAPGENKIMPFFVRLAPHHFLEYSTATPLDRRAFANGVQTILWARRDATVETRLVVPARREVRSRRGALAQWESPCTLCTVAVADASPEIICVDSATPLRCVILDADQAGKVWDLASPDGPVVAITDLRIMDSSAASVTFQADSADFTLDILAPREPKLGGPFAGRAATYQSEFGLYRATGNLDLPTPEFTWTKTRVIDDLVWQTPVSPDMLTDDMVELCLQADFDGFMGYAYLDGELISDHAFGPHIPWEIHLRDKLTAPGTLRLVFERCSQAAIAVRPIVQFTVPIEWL